MMRRFGLTAALMVVTFAGACGPQPAGAPATGAGQLAPSQPRADPEGTQKTLRVLVQREPNGFSSISQTGSSSATSGGSRNVLFLAHDHLTAEIELDTFVPQLADALPSVARGTWVLNPDGTMDVTWKLRPNTKWHDGTALDVGRSALFVHHLYGPRSSDHWVAASSTRLSHGAGSADVCRSVQDPEQ